MQKRIKDYGAPVVAKDLKDLIKALSGPAILSGNDFVVYAANQLRLTPGTALTDQGVLIIEDEPKYLTIPNTTGAVDYTVYYDHVDSDISGGVPAVLQLATGLLSDSSVSGVVLGYVRYPGSAVPLSTTHFLTPAKARLDLITPTINSADWDLPINGQGYVKTNQVGNPFDYTNVWDPLTPVMYHSIRNNGIAVGTISLIFPFKVKDIPFAKMQTRIGVDVNATVTPTFIATDGGTAVLGTAPISGTSGVTFISLDIPRGLTQTPNTLVYLQLVIQCQPTREVKLQAIGLTPFNLPI